MTTAHDLLTEPVLSWRDAQRRRGKTTLPGTLAKLATSELVDFSRLRTHQFDPWAMFLTQLAAVALRRANATDPRLSESEWRTMLLQLTDGAHEPWCLVVEDLARPAFFQPPVPSCGIAKWSRLDHPDDLDVLVTAKNHDVKKSLIHSDDIESWIFALVTLQTMQGYPGRGYNRISRMRGGYGSRLRLGLAPDRTPGARFSRDIQVLLDTWDHLVNRRGFAADGLGLVWTAPWNGTSSLSIAELSPHFIEVCWRVRCETSPHGVSCAYTTTECRRCLPEIEDGDVGDPWVPIERDKGALTVGRAGFRYELLTRLLFEGDFEAAAAQQLRPGDGDPVLLLASVMARGQGKTDGLHERVLPFTGAARRRLGQPETRAAIGKRAGANVKQAKTMGRNVLFPALRMLALDDAPLLDRFDARVDEAFFDQLFATLDDGDEDARLTWDRRLEAIAREELQRAIKRCGVPSARWYKAASDAERMFHACLIRQFPQLENKT